MAFKDTVKLVGAVIMDPAGTTVNTVDTVSDGRSAGTGLMANAQNYLSNASTWDRQRNNNQATNLASAARTANTAGADIVNYNGRGVRVSVDLTVQGSNVTPQIDVKDALSGAYIPVLTGPAMSTATTVPLIVYPGVLASANYIANLPLARTFRVYVTHANASAATYSVSHDIML